MRAKDMYILTRLDINGHHHQDKHRYEDNFETAEQVFELSKVLAQT